jgi:hypothetical protein
MSILKAGRLGKVNPERIIAYRKQAGALLEAVLSEDVSPRAALNCWPMAGNEDSSVQCAYTMLWFFESDEDRHKTELFYSDVQLNALIEVSGCLKKGERLPTHFLNEYRGLIAPSEYHFSGTWMGLFRWFNQHARMMQSILDTSLWLQTQQKSTKGPRKRPF